MSVLCTRCTSPGAASIIPATRWMPKRAASAPSAPLNSPSSSCANGTESAPIAAVKYDEYSGKTTSRAPRATASSASRVISARFAAVSSPGANCATATAAAAFSDGAMLSA